MVDALGVTDTTPDAKLLPTLLVAVTVQLYAVPLVRLETVIGLPAPAPVLVFEPLTQAAVYPVMVAPPLELGAVKAMLALALPAVAAPMVGAPGTVAGVTETAEDATPAPFELVAVTVQL